MNKRRWSRLHNAYSLDVEGVLVFDDVAEDEAAERKAGVLGMVHEARAESV
jgi:hypothetical protein